MLLRKPSRGEPVRKLQRALNKAGLGPITEDGIFGLKTEIAVRKFQDQSGLTVDGVVGSKTTAILFSTEERSGVALKIISALKAKEYQVLTEGKINIIGVRSNNPQSNSFDDKIYLVWEEGGEWWHKSYPCTCDPGTYWLENGNIEGTAILQPGQYPVYKFDLHQGKYETLCQRAGPVKVWRDSNKDDQLDWGDGEGIEGWYGINIHHAGANSTRVDRWSAGCQVFAKLADWEEAMRICKGSNANVFVYTLLEEDDVGKAQV